MHVLRICVRLELEVILSLDNQGLELGHSGGFERNRANEHRVQAHAGTPHVDFEASVALVKQDFGRDIRRGAALFFHTLSPCLKLPGYAEIANFNISSGIK